ncbi:MAG: VWA domain-containing protein, partial [Treponema sp.]|nr:VWA domain-containing protein [Treponema sp.]
YIRHASDRKEVIDAIEKLRPIKDGNTFMRQALAAAYTLINEIKDKGQYNNWVVLLTDGEQIENRDPTETKKLVNELVKQHKEEGIGTNVSTVSFFDPNAKAHMEEVAKLGGGTSLFIENEEHLPSQARLASLVIERDQLQKQINTEWKNTEFDVILLCNDGVSLQKADPYNEQEPQIQGNTLIYPHIRLGHIPLGKLISLEVSLSEDAVNQKATILSLSAISRDQSFSLLENYPISFDNPVTADGETGFLTFVIKKDKRGK